MNSLVAFARSHGASPEHLAPLWRSWLAGETPEPSSRRARAPRSFLEALPELRARLERLATVRSEHLSSDGSRRLLVELADGASVEAVLLPRGALCISTHVGCSVGCLFCKTGEQGLLRQLSSAEIVAQVAVARRLGEARRVVLMDMGEPADRKSTRLNSSHT